MTLTPKQINRLIQLKAEGYTDSDTAMKVRASISSVKKYKKIHAVEIAKAKKPVRKEPSEKFLSVENDLHTEVTRNRNMILKLIDLLVNTDFFDPVEVLIREWNKDFQVESLAYSELHVWKHVFDIDPDLGKKLLKKNRPYEFWIEDALSSEDPKASGEYHNYLCPWINFVKERCPELLSDFKDFL